MLGGSCFCTNDKACALPEHCGTVEMITPERLMQMQMLVRGARPIVTFPFILEAKHE
jgi:hypothetical protein